MGNSSVENKMMQSAVNEKLQQNDEQVFAQGEIVIPIGKMEDGSVLIQDVGKIPHFLVCGFSGTGKSSFIQTLIINIAAQYSPEKVKFIIYDSKSVDHAIFNTMPQLLFPVVTESQKATAIFHMLYVEEEMRIKLFYYKSAKDIISYNKRSEKSDNGPLPHLFVILDDFSSLRLDQDAITTLLDVLKNGRTTGIHFVIVTSMVSSKMLQKDILSSIPCRIAFCVSSRADSRTAIEQNGAESLSVPGELMFRWQDQLVKCQSIYISDEEAANSIKRIQQQSRKSISVLGNMAVRIFDDLAKKQDQEPIETNFDVDPLFADAVEVVMEADMASTALLQRRLKIGYARAARILDKLEEQGIIGPYEGAKPRKVLLTRAQWIEQKYGDSISSPIRAVETSVSPVSVMKSAPVKKESGERPDIEMRDFAQFRFSGTELCIRNNQIEITKRVMTKLGPGISTGSFNGKIVADLVYKQPYLFSKGYIQFKLRPNIDIVNRNTELADVSSNNLPDFLKIEFGKDAANTMKYFMIQISEDIGIPLTVL